MAPAPQLIGPEGRSTPADLRTSRTGERRLPDDILREASHRLGIISLMGAVLWTLGTVFAHFARHAISPEVPILNIDFSDAISVAGISSSAALFAWSRRSLREPAFILDVGLGYLIFTGFLIGLVWHWDGSLVGHQIQPMITWTGTLVLIFAAVVPNSPKKVLLAGLITVSMNPIGMLIARERGSWAFASSWDVLLMHYPDYMLVGVSITISLVVTRLGQQVSKAREMGSYQLGELIGRGGMGEVYHATHRMLARPAAIKLIRPAMLAPGGGDSADLAIRRFKREAEVAANLRSPHTVELYDFGVTPDQTLYFVMELLEGMNLEALVRQHGPVPASRVIHIIRQVCASLEEAHERGLVHRDIKPANIHIGTLGLEHDFVKVLDFGLVKSMQGTTGEHSMATGTGMAPGTPDYMAPEMLLLETVDGRSDLYAVGCVAYWLLTGVPVFDGTSVYAVIAKHMNDVPVPPSRRAPQPIPPKLEQLVLACLAKKPAERPASAAALGAALKDVEAERWTEDHAAAWWKTNGGA